MSEDNTFNLEARLDFIIGGLTDAIAQLSALEKKLDGTVTAAADLDEKFHTTGAGVDSFSNRTLDATETIAGLKTQIGELALALSGEDAAVSRGSSEWVKRVQAVSAASREYSTFRRNQLTGDEGKPGIDINAGSGTAQAEDVKTLAVKNANYATEVVAASDRIAAAQKRLQAVEDSANYDKQVAELGALGAAQARVETSTTRLETAHGALATNIGNNASLPAQANSYEELATAEERAAREAATLAVEQQRATAVTEKAAAVQAKLREQLAAVQGKSKKLDDETAYDAQVKSIGQVAAAQNRARTSTKDLRTAEGELAAVRASAPADLERQIAAEGKVVAAKEKNRTATRELEAAEKQANNVASTPKKLLGLNIAEGQLPRIRYALYDLSFAAMIAGGALTGMFVGSIAAAASFESEFAQVRRTTGVFGQDAANLQKQFVSLSQTIPVSFKDLSSIGALGGQLNVASSDLSNFTKVTAQFSATTNVSIDQSGTALGRLNQLLPDVGGNYEALASSILKVGVNSVATESQIIQISQNIAGIATTVGLTASQVVGLSGALASIGIAPEAARSTVTRLFVKIQEAIDGDSASLAKFGKLSGETGDQFRAAFKADAGSALVDMLKGVNANGDNAIATLQALGLTSVRDIPNLLKLAQNTDTLQSALGLASDGFKNASELGNEYGVTSQTLSAHLQELGNTAVSLFAAIGNSQSGGLNDLIVNFTDFLKLLTNFASNPGNQAWIAWTLGITGALGALALGIAVAARFTGSLAAMQTLLGEVTVAKNAKAAATRAAAEAELAETGAIAGNTVALEAETAATDASGLAAKNATTSIRLMKGALLGTGIGIAVAVLGTFVSALVAYSSEQDNAADAANKFFGGDTSSLVNGFKADREAAGVAIQSITTSVAKNTTAAASWVPALDAATGAQAKLDESTTKTTKKIQDQTVAYGENAKKALANLLGNSADFKKLFKPDKSVNALEGFGLDKSAFTKAILDDPTKGGQQYINKLLASMSSQLHVSEKSLKQQIHSLSLGDNTSLFPGIDQAKSDKIKAIIPAYKLLAAAASNTGIAAKDSAQKFAQSSAIAKALGSSAAGAAGGVDALGNSLDVASDPNISFSSTLKDSIDQAFTLSVATQKLGTDVGSLGQAFSSGGAQAALGGSALSTVLQDIAATSSSGPQAAAGMSVLFTALVQGGYASVAQLQPLLASMSALTGSTVSLGATGPSVNSMLAALKSGAKGAGSSAGGAAKQIRTLVDYGNDLSGVFKRIGDFRFGPQNALDSISKAWIDISDSADAAQGKIKDASKAIDDANQKARNANATLMELSADKSNSEYWLRIAQMYGDAERVKKIQADLAKNATDTTKASGDLSDANSDGTNAGKDLATARDAASKTLAGSSKAAIDNRSALQGLVEKYGDLITAYAATGVPADQLKVKTAQLKAQFVAQATQAGFSSDAVMGYASSFDSMSAAISRVPRNITVGLDIADPSAAIAEFMAKFNAAAKGSGGGGGGGGGGLDISSLLDGLGGSPAAPTKTIVFNGDTKLVGDALNELYASIDKKQPKVRINGETKPAAEALTDVLAAISRGESYVQINGTFTKAKTARDGLIADINRSVGSVTIDGFTVPAGDALAKILGDVHKSKARVTINGDKLPAIGVLNEALIAISQGKQFVAIGGKDQDARKVLAAALDAINSSDASVKVRATFDGAYGTGASAAALTRGGFVDYFYRNPLTANFAANAGGKIKVGNYGFYDQGGFTGPGAKHDVAGYVHKGEYVFPQEAVRYYGVENLAHAHQRAIRGYADGGPVGGSMPRGFGGGSASSAVSQMSASDRLFFRDLFQEFAGSLKITDGAIAQAANSANARLVKAGAR